MIKVRVKGEGVKLANKWCYIGDEATIDEVEFEKNKQYIDVIEKIEEPKVPASNAGENQNPEGEPETQSSNGNDTNVGSTEGENNLEENNGEGAGENNESEDEELEALKERAKELGIKNVHNMKKETLIAKIQETEASNAGENQNPEGE